MFVKTRPRLSLTKMNSGITYKQMKFHITDTWEYLGTWSCSYNKWISIKRSWVQILQPHMQQWMSLFCYNLIHRTLNRLHRLIIGCYNNCFNYTCLFLKMAMNETLNVYNIEPIHSTKPCLICFCWAYFRVLYAFSLRSK